MQIEGDRRWGSWINETQESIKTRERILAEEKRKAAEATDVDAQMEPLSTGELHERAENQLLRKEAKQRVQELQGYIAKLLGTTPEYVNNEYNGQQIEQGLKAYLKANRRQWLDPRFKKVGWDVPTWTEDDINRVADHLAAEGRLELNARWVRKTPTEKELYAMPLTELSELAESANRPEQQVEGHSPGSIFSSPGIWGR